MVRQFDHLNQVINRNTGYTQTGGFEPITVSVVHLVAVPMALDDGAAAVHVRSERVIAQMDILPTETHRAAEVRLFAAHFRIAAGILPFGDQPYDGVRRILVELRTHRILETREVTRRLDYGNLHTEADAKIWGTAHAGVTDRLDLAFNATNAKAAGHHDAVHLFKAGSTVIFDLLRLDVMNIYPGACMNAAMQ